MRVEQRIGRCDRIGQASNKVHVRSLASEGTIESRILSRLYERLGIFERALGDLELVLGETIASFERDLFRRGLSPRQQEERLERAAQAIENNEQHRELISRASVISEQGRHLIESDQQEIREAESRFLSPVDLAEFVLSVLTRHLPNSVIAGTVDYQFDVIGNPGFRDALQGLLTSYPTTHHARIEIVRFRNRMDQQRRLRVSFTAESEGIEFVHTRHPLMLLARHVESRQLSDTPWSLGVVPLDMLERPKTLVWAIGSLDGYATRAELLCAAVDTSTGEVSPITVEHAQKLLLAMSELQDGQSADSFDVEDLRTRAEQFLMSEFSGVATVFAERDRLLTEKAESAVRSHAKRQLIRNERQLAKDDLNVNLRNMYLGWNRRIEDETESRLTEIRRKSGIRSSLEIIGMAVLSPLSGSSSR